MAVKQTIVWDSKICKAEKWLEPSVTHGDKVYDRYKDKRQGADENLKKVNLFYANVNTLKESLFNSLPKADVKKIHKGNYNDDITRVACIIAGRVLDYETECAPSFHEAMTMAVLDRLVPGTGQAWMGFEMEQGEDGKMIQGTEHITVDKLHWKDFIYEPCRSWGECSWVGRKHHYTQKDFEEEFPEGMNMIGAARSSTDAGEYNPTDLNKGKICVYEIWDKKTKKVQFRYKGLDKPLREMDDPLKLKNFFPCPRPLIANVNSDEFLAVTDYYIAQDQYNQLDVLYARISLIIEAVKVAGCYDAEAGNSITRMLTEGQNKLIPVDNWAMYMEKGGAKGLIDWYPVEQVATVLNHLQIQFEAIKGLLAEISGMSDIVRGDTNQYETAKAQQIKAGFASVRLNGYQRDVAFFVRDTMRIMADLAFGLYSDEKLIEIVGDLEEPDRQYIGPAMQILRSDLMTKYRVNIQADSLTQQDWALEKGQRQEIVQVLGSMIGQVVPMVQEIPELAPLAVQMIKFAISGYKGASELEGWIDQQLDQMQRKAIEAQQNPQPKEPTPEEIKAKAEMEKIQMEAGIKQQEAQTDQQAQQQKMALEQQKMEMELQHKKEMFALEMQMKQMELQFKQREATMKVQTSAVASQMDLAQKQEQNEMANEQTEVQNAQANKQAAEVAKQKAKEPKPKSTK